MRNLRNIELAQRFKLDRPIYIKVERSNMFPRTDSDGNPKLFEELGNRPTFSVGAAFPTWRINPDTGKREAAYASNVSVATCTQGVLEVDEIYESVGEVWATVWANSQGRIQYSLVAEGFKKAAPEGESK